MDKEKVGRSLDKLFRDMAGAMTAGMLFVGARTGLFCAMAGKGPLRLEDVVRDSKLQPRYVEEWLKGMVSAGYVEYDSSAQSYRLPDEHAFFLASEGTDHFVGGLFEMVPVLMKVAPKVAESFRKGGGVHFHEYGPEGVHALDLINRGQYELRFADYWLKALPGSVERLRSGGRVLDFGCGAGRVCIALAKAFPQAEVTGYDVDPASLEAAAKAAAVAGLEGRIDFRDGKPAGKKFDLITLCDAVHDLAEPVKTLQEVRALLEPGGTLFIIEPKAADRLEDNRNPVATMFYGFSIVHCMTQSLAAGGPGLGTCLGPAGTERVVREAGFSSFRILDIKSQTNLFYAANP